MDILYRGKKPEDVEYVGTCSPVAGGCGTKVKFKRSEATDVASTPNGKGYLKVSCPICKKEIRSYFDQYVKPDNYPSCM